MSNEEIESFWQLNAKLKHTEPGPEHDILEQTVKQLKAEYLKLVAEANGKQLQENAASSDDNSMDLSTAVKLLAMSCDKASAFDIATAQDEQSKLRAKAENDMRIKAFKLIIAKLNGQC